MLEPGPRRATGEPRAAPRAIGARQISAARGRQSKRSLLGPSNRRWKSCAWSGSARSKRRASDGSARWRSDAWAGSGASRRGRAGSGPSSRAAGNGIGRSTKHGALGNEATPSAARRIADKWTKRAERNAARMRARAHRRSRHAELPRAFLIPASIGLTIATIAVILSLRVVVPTVLTLLSIFFGSRLRDAAGRVSDAGRRAGEAMERARAFVHRRPVGRSREVRVEEDKPRARVRFSERTPRGTGRVDSEIEEQAEEEAAEAHERTARRGR